MALPMTREATNTSGIKYLFFLYQGRAEIGSMAAPYSFVYN